MDIVIHDAGTTVILKHSTKEGLLTGLEEIEPHGYRRLADPVQVGSMWIVTCSKPGAGSATKDNCTVERLGMSVFIRGPSESAVREAVDNLRTGGAKLVSIEQIGNEWQAVCDAPR
jgi:hypothetical protein